MSFKIKYKHPIATQDSNADVPKHPVRPKEIKI